MIYGSLSLPQKPKVLGDNFLNIIYITHANIIIFDIF